MNDELLIEYEQEKFDDATPIYRVVLGDLSKQSSLPDPLLALAKSNGFRGEPGVVLSSPEGVLLGVGDGDDPFSIAGVTEKLQTGTYKIVGDLSDDAATLAAQGWLMGAYRFSKYKTQSEAKAKLVVSKNTDIDHARSAGEAISKIRDLINTPAGDMLPDELEEEASLVAKAYGAELTVIKGDQLLAQNFPLIHAVGRASSSAPRLIDIQWGDVSNQKITLVGKGVCFDSGGLDIKGSAGMLLMKKDMGGAAHVLALGQMIMDAALSVRLRILIPAVENAISGNAFRPGDVVPSRKGLSVEIGNTDAEGRLVLADAMCLAEEGDPGLIVTMATLTGAARIALGSEVIPFYTDDDDLAADISNAALVQHDPVWRMPLWKNYDGMLASPIADMNNVSSGSFAGSITAALFLKRFLAKPDRWVHFDIYGWAPKATTGKPFGGAAQAIHAVFGAIKARIS